MEPSIEMLEKRDFPQVTLGRETIQRKIERRNFFEQAKELVQLARVGNNSSSMKLLWPANFDF